MSEVVTVDIESIAAGGDGVARLDGLVVFVPRTAPGDRATVRLRRSRRMARGTLLSLDLPSPARAAPACPHYDADACGGCQLQHLSPLAQLEAKQGIVRDALRRIGRQELHRPAIRPAPTPWRYRRKLTLALRRRAAGDWIGGFHPWHDPSAVFPLEDCHIADPQLVKAWRLVLDAAADLPDADALRGTVRLDAAGFVLAVEGGAAWPRAEQFATRVPGLLAAWWTPTGGARRAVYSAPGAPPAGASFVQVNPPVAAELFQTVLAAVRARGPRHVIDAYGGVGDLAASLHADGIRVTTIEADSDASALAAARLARPSRAITARVEHVLADALPADAIVVNPPRVGLHADAAAALEAASDVRHLLYVSCDPATLARDIARMPSWRLASVECFDMFPQTAHVETVAIFERRDAA